MVGTSLNLYRNGERFLKGSLLLAALGPGVITAPLGLGLSCILVPIAFFLWPIAWARDFIMALALLAFVLAWLSFAWSPKSMLPKWLRPLALLRSGSNVFTDGARKVRGLSADDGHPPAPYFYFHGHLFGS
jgi:hypothetical protein